MLPQNGGVNLFCAEERNDAQYLVWLGVYLAPTALRPKWAFVADHIFRSAMIKEHRKRMPDAGITNPFHQCWRPNLRKLPLTLRRLYRVAKKYGLVIDDPEIPETVKEQMSLWAHPAMPSLARGRRATNILRCLRTNHAIRTIEDLDEVAELDVPEHVNDIHCDCDNCEDDRSEGCRNPAACQEMAQAILAQLPERWNLSARQLTQAEDMRCTLEPPSVEELDNGETSTFDRDMRQDKELWELYRVFGNSIAVKPAPPEEIMQRDSGVAEQVDASGDALQVTVCSAMDQDNTDGASGGFAVMFSDVAMNGIWGHISDPDATHASAALDGIRAAAEYAPPERVLHVVTNSRGAARALTVHLKLHEKLGWTDVPKLSRAGRLTAAALRARPADTTITYVSKNRYKSWPEVRDTMLSARGVANGGEGYGEENNAHAESDRPGLALVGLTQRAAHRAIKQAKAASCPNRKATTTNLARIKEAIRDATGTAPKDSQIWEDLRREGLSRKTQNFIWKAIHGAHKVGEYFEKMPEPWKSYGRCASCDVPESMEHILTQCPDSGQETMWRLTAGLLKTKLITFDVNYGLILGCCSARIRGSAVADRLFKIAVSETAFLIWKIRCTHRIEHDSDPGHRLPEAELAARWEKAMELRLHQDLALTKYKNLRGRRPQNWVAQSTWRDDSDYRNSLYLKGKLIGPGVLVSIGSFKASLGIG
ncbi:hypothetical protein AURDEDRAFT_76679 [Auricularia subglabra TFB-10046 SS5]|uniref:Reverse transcriptase zinc-binding domain-containing protein n=1 Tax=Auricularia subglabra (strain TFB-10046 / SS5) TaxID=717982 RepID=J0WPK6_AURST|nr:hypothetical protein AURDEDRAFT_76679 [Auricularia subglabra TFB-10046 SS5]